MTPNRPRLASFAATSAAAALALALALAWPGPAAAGKGSQAEIERGRYLVNAAGCNDCHTPLIMGPNGPMRDPNHLLAGHPEQLEMPPAPATSGAWNVTVGATMTAWNGPWGTSFTANLTPDPETGLGTWNTQTFIDTIRNARHMGRGRPLLPPMPADMIANYTDEDLGVIFAYLQSIPPIVNHVPAPLPPAETASAR